MSMTNLFPVLLVMSFNCFAEETVQRSKAPHAAQGPVLLSEVLPEPLARFVKNYGVDQTAHAEIAERFVRNLERGTLDPKPAGVIDTLKPRYYSMLAGPVTIAEVITPDDVAANGTEPESMLVAGTRVLLGGGAAVAFGGTLAIGDVIERGVVLNGGDTEVVVKDSEGATVLLRGEALYVVSQEEAKAYARELAKRSAYDMEGEVANTVAGSSCSCCNVACLSGYYACCNHRGLLSCAKCKCVRDGTDPVPDCDAGGPGSLSCAVCDEN